MGLTSLIRAKIQGWASGAGAKSLTPSTHLESEGWNLLYGAPPDWASSTCDQTKLSTADRENAYGIHPVVRRCTALIADTAPLPEMEIGMWLNGEWERLDGPHWVKELMEDPNPNYSFREITRKLVARWALTGIGYLIKIRQEGGRGITQLWPVPTSMVAPVKSHEGLQMFAGYRVTGTDRIFPPEDVIAMRDLDPATMDGATAMFGSAERDYALDIERLLYQMDMLVNLKVPGVIIKTENELNPKTKEKLRETFRQRYGRGHRAEPLFLHGGGSVDTVNPLSDLDFPGLSDLSESRICTAFGTSPILINARVGLENSTYSNYDVALKAFYFVTMTPLWELLGEALTLGLLKNEGESLLRIRYMYRDLPQFQEDKTATSTRAATQYNSGIAQLNEARQDVGLEEIGPEGDTFKQTLGSLLGAANTSPAQTGE